MPSIRVMIIDESAVARQELSARLAEEAGIEVIGVAADPLIALEKIKLKWPDVIVMDLTVPYSDGVSFLRKIMVERPIPVVICSSLTQPGAEATAQALAAGAVRVITKPRHGLKRFLEESGDELVSAVRASARANPGQPAPILVSDPPPKLSADVILSAPTAAMESTTPSIVAIGTSTGGTQALEAVLTALPPLAPGIVIVQHMPERFTEAFANRLDGLCQISVREARNGDPVAPGLALIAPGGRHVLVKRNGSQYYVEVVDGPLVCRHRPSVDVLFRSVAKYAGRNALGIIMTGMGDDGAKGLKEMHDMGAKTLAQDEESCAVYGMPKEAVKLGGVDKIVSLSQIPQEIVTFARQSAAAPGSV